MGPSDDSDGQEFELNRPRKRQNLGGPYKEKKVAKSKHEMTADILGIFKEREVYAMEELMKIFGDQPDNFIKEMINSMCERVNLGVTGSKAEYRLKSSF
mmetsp:Transcript_8441/g.14151  ORF Transcript_8441/g.14151 Transcript_8441/m.14151 type:complete len:99 (-) Transcript_8441:75-371(-)